MSKTTIKIEDLKKGDKIEFNHCRKGLIQGEVVSSNDEWLTVELLTRVRGLANQWNKGDELTSRKSFISDITTLD